MSRRWRLAIFFAGAIPLGLLAALLWPVGGYWTTGGLMFVYQLLVQPWAMLDLWWWRKEDRDRLPRRR